MCFVCVCVLVCVCVCVCTRAEGMHVEVRELSEINYFFQCVTQGIKFRLSGLHDKHFLY